MVTTKKLRRNIIGSAVMKDRNYSADLVYYILNMLNRLNKFNQAN